MTFSVFRSLAYQSAQSVEAVVARASWFPAADELWDSAGVRAAAERLAEKEAEEEVSEPDDGLSTFHEPAYFDCDDDPIADCHIPNLDDLPVDVSVLCGLTSVSSKIDLAARVAQVDLNVDDEAPPFIRPRIATRTDSDRLDHILALLEDIRNTLK